MMIEANTPDYENQGIRGRERFDKVKADGPLVGRVWRVAFLISLWLTIWVNLVNGNG